MSRYIDANALAHKVVINSDADLINKVTKLMIDAPSIEIIRCGECKWRKAKMMPKSVKCLFSGNADDFCSYGERREP